MDFLKISIWLYTTVLSVNSLRSHLNCPYYPFNYVNLIHDQRNCFCFHNQKDYRKVPEVINHGGLLTERVVYYVYKDLLSGRVTLYIPNREKQIHIPDLAWEEDDIIFDNPGNFLHSFNDLKVIIEINQAKYVTNEPVFIDDTVTTVTTHKPTTTTEAPTTITDGLTVTNEKPTTTTVIPTVTTKKSSFHTEEPSIPTVKHTLTTEEPTTVTNKATVTIEEETVTSIIRTNTTDEPSGTTEVATTITAEPPVTNKKPTVTTENPTDSTNEPTVTIEQATVTDVIKTTTTGKPTVTTERLTTIKDKLSVITEIPTVSTELPTVITEKPTGTTVSTFITEEPTTITDEPAVATEIPTGTTEEATTITAAPPVTNKKPTVTTEKPTDSTNEPTVTIEQGTVTTGKPIVITVSTLFTEEPTTAHTKKITINTEATTVTTKVPSSVEPITIESTQPATEVTPPVTPELITFATKEPTTEEPSTTKTPEPTISTAEPTTKEPSPVTISPLPNDDSQPGKVFSLQDLYYIIQFIQNKKDNQEPIVDIWEQILKTLKLDKSQVNKHSELNKDGGTIEFEIRDDSDLDHDSYTFDLWFEQQLDGFSESDQFISLAEIKQYVRNILLENGMIVTMEGLLTDLQGKLLDLRELKLRPILIGKPLNIGKIFDQKDHKSDFLIPSDSPYMQAIVVTLSNPSMILGIIPLGKTIIKKNVQKSVTVPPHGKHEGMVKEWVQNGNKYSKHGKKWKENMWFNIKGHPKLSVERKDLYSLPPQKKIIKHKYFEEPKNGKNLVTFNPAKDGYEHKSSRLVEILEGNDLRKLDALKNQLFKDQKKFATQKDLLTAWQNDGIIQTGEGQPIRLNVDPNELEAWENLLKDTTRSEKEWLATWKNTADTHTDGELISGLDVDDSMKLDILKNQLLMDSKLIPAKELHTSWQHFGHLEPGNVKLDRIELDAFNHKLVNRPISSEANEMLSSWQKREKVHAGSGQVISFKAENASELDALKNQLLNNPTLYGKAGLKLLAALQRNDIVKADRTSETINYDVDNLSELDQLGKLLKDPAMFAKTAQNLFRALQRKGFVQAENGEAVKLKVHNPRELEVLRNQLLTHPKIFSRAAKELLTVMEHNGIGLSDIAPLINETAATSPEDCGDCKVPWAEKGLYTQEYLSPQKIHWPSKVADGYYEEVEDDITGRIVGGSAATGSGAPLSMKGRMKDF